MQTEVAGSLGFVLPELEPESEVADIVTPWIKVGGAILAWRALGSIRLRSDALLLVAWRVSTACASLMPAHAPEHLHLVLAACRGEVGAVPDVYAAALAIKAAEATAYVDLLI